MIHRTFGLAVLFALSWTVGVHAQDFGSVRPGAGQVGSFGTQFGGPVPLNLSTAYVDVTQVTPSNAPNRFDFTTAGYMPLSAFASASSVAAISQSVDAVSQRVGDISRQLGDIQKKNAELSALAASFTISPPNAGDRFSLTMSAAGWDTYGAGSISGAYRVNDSTLMFAGYARGPTQNMAKGGVSMSFR